MTLKGFLDIVACIGIPSFFTICVYFIKVTKNFNKKVEIIMTAVQRQMRRDLLTDFHRFISQGYIEDDDLAEWESRYQSYHDLGKNGIMDSKRKQLMELPNEKPN